MLRSATPGGDLNTTKYWFETSADARTSGMPPNVTPSLDRWLNALPRDNNKTKHNRVALYLMPWLLSMSEWIQHMSLSSHTILILQPFPTVGRSICLLFCAGAVRG